MNALGERGREGEPRAAAAEEHLSRWHILPELRDFPARNSPRPIGAPIFISFDFGKSTKFAEGEKINRAPSMCARLNNATKSRRGRHFSSGPATRNWISRAYNMKNRGESFRRLFPFCARKNCNVFALFFSRC